MPTPAKTAPASDAAAHLMDQFADLVFSTAPAGELDGLDAAARAALVAHAFEVFAGRAPGSHAVHVGAGEGEAGHRRMLIVLVTDDMPFLVDSASAAVSAAGLEIHRLLHPIMAVRRDATGALLSIGNVEHGRESVIVMEVDRAPARRRQELAQELGEVYADVRAAVADWRSMQARLLASARQLNEAPPPVAPHVLAETIAFIEWLAADNFTFLGFTDGREQLGILARDGRFSAPADIGGDRHAPLLIGKSGERATVHRRIEMDVVTIRGFAADGRPEGAAHFLGLFTSAALNESPRRVPLVRRKVAQVTEALGYDPRGHAGKALAHVIETFPREELFSVDAARLGAMAEGLLSLLDRPRPRLFASAAGGNVSALVYVPRDAFSADLRQRVGAMLARETGATVARFDVELRAEGLARVHYVLQGATRPVDEAALDHQLTQLTRGWEDELELVLAQRTGPMRAARLALSHGRAFSAGYRDEFTPSEAATDICRLTALSTADDRAVSLWRRDDDDPTVVRLKIYRLEQVIPLSDSVPILENFGFRVIEEVPWDLAEGTLGWVHDFKLELAQPPADFAALAARVEPALTAVLAGAQENDLFNALIPTTGLPAEEANWLRAWFRYLRQTGVAYGIATAVEALRRNPAATTAIVALFRARHEGSHDADAAAAAEAGFADAIDAVAAIDEDRILRLFKALVDAMLRTNAFAPGGVEALAFKLDSARVPGLPKPLPWREMWVYSPRVEGIHLRGGPIARGGLRWSDRRDDFRTEVLGLVKAQIVKNSVIVPTGAKGGFYPKQLPDPARSRDAWAAEGEGAYRVFIRALLSVTDNLGADGGIVPPEGVVRLDPGSGSGASPGSGSGASPGSGSGASADDPYLVVAADKGTATFSDTANAIAEEAGFWLGDAFASGGSVGYDHKAMGITARGAWVSVTRHFAEMGIDVARDSVTVVGIGDMSGDVFGNGMLLSCSLKLVAAFDHRHIFIDPAPDRQASFAERQRLFALPRSTWADYDARLISKGGGVFPRSQKAIPLSPEARALLGTTLETATPSELIAAILKARVDLLWFGGIGTYAKASGESHADVGDRANDAHRVNAADLKARVIGEGANLGITQAGRIEFALAGGRINTDFIDNSAGVDTSDHEVNIKIALGRAVAAGSLARPERDGLLADMTDAVAAHVLGNNQAQTLALSVAESRAAAMLPGHQHLMEALVAGGLLDRAVEGLPGPREIAERQRQGRGLTRPELAILLSYAKMELKDRLVDSAVVDDPLLEADVVAAFPPLMQERFRAQILGHRLRREIAATALANELVNRGGLTLAHDVAADLGCGLATVGAAFVSARTLFDLPGLWAAIDAADVASAVRLALLSEAQAVARLLVADLARRSGADSPATLTARLAPGIARLAADVDRLLRPEPRLQVEATRARLDAMGAPPAVAARVANLIALSGAPGIAALASDRRLGEAEVAEAYTRLGERLGIDWAKGAAGAVHPADSWERLLASTTARGFETMRLDFIRRETPEGGDPLRCVDAWLGRNAQRAESLAHDLGQARASGPPTVAMLAQLAAQARATLGI